MRGFVKVSAAVPIVKVTDFEFNRTQIFGLWERAYAQKSIVVVFPELCITSYSAKDLLNNIFLLQEAEKSIRWLLERGKGIQTVAVVGLPIVYQNSLYNCAVAIQNDKVLCIVPKSYLPNYGEFEEARWFRQGRFVGPGKTMEFAGQTVPFGTDVLLHARNIPNCKIGIEICEDMWVQTSPHIYQVNAGATIIANLSASNFIIGKAEIREFLVRSISDKGKCSYIFTSVAPGESSELAWDGQHFICENGALIAEGTRFSRKSEILTTDIDLECLVHERIRIGTFGDCAYDNQKEFREVPFEAVEQDRDKNLLRNINRHPFIPSDASTLALRCWEVFEIQTNSLRTRLEKVGCKNIVLGVSGGLDSTLAALSAANVLDAMGLPRTNLYCLTMPGLGTSANTRENSICLARYLGATLSEISIKDVSYTLLQATGHVSTEEADSFAQFMQNLKNHPEFADTTLENLQARLRTLLLMTYANKINGLVVGTGDLSEKALGWCTYAGDQISMYDINSGIPKTLMQFVIKWVMNERVNTWAVGNPEELKQTLSSILNTPISPELLPVDFQGQISQLSEETIGPYELNDFFLYWHVRHGSTPQKILDIAQIAFAGVYELVTIKKWLKKFYIRFASQQFKRNASADGPKIGMVDLSPRVSWRMATDTEWKSWVDQVEKYQEIVV